MAEGKAAGRVRAERWWGALPETGNPANVGPVSGWKLGSAVTREAVIVSMIGETRSTC